MRTLGLWVLLLYGIISEQTDLFCRDRCGKSSSGTISKLDKYDTTRTIEPMCRKEIETITSTTTPTLPTTTQTTTTTTPTSSTSTFSKDDTTTTESMTTTATVNGPSTSTNPSSTIQESTAALSIKTTVTSLVTTTEQTEELTILTTLTNADTTQSTSTSSPLTSTLATSSSLPTLSAASTNVSTFPSSTTIPLTSSPTSTLTAEPITVNNPIIDTTQYTTTDTTWRPWTKMLTSSSTVLTGTPVTTSAPSTPSSTRASATSTKNPKPTFTLSSLLTPIPVTETTKIPSTSKALTSGLSTTESAETSYLTVLPKSTTKLAITVTPSTNGQTTQSPTTGTKWADKLTKLTSTPPENWNYWSEKITQTPTRTSTVAKGFTSTSPNTSTTKVPEARTENSAPTLYKIKSSTSKPLTIRTPLTSTASTTTISSTNESRNTNMATTNVNNSKSSTVKTTPGSTKFSSSPESFTITTIKEASTIGGHQTVNLEKATIITVEESTPSSTPTPITETNVQRTTTEIKILTSSNSDMPTSLIPSSPTDGMSTVHELSSTTQRIFEPSTKVYSTPSTDQGTIDIEISKTTSYPSTNTVSETESKPALEDTTSWIGALELTTTKTEEITPTAESETTGSSTTLPSTTDLSTEVTTVSSSYRTDSTTETTLDATSLSTELITQETTTTEIDASTETPSTRPPWCDYPCPYGYIEAERGCFIMVPEEFRQNFMSAFMWCRSEDRRDLSDQGDIMTSNMIETLKYMLRLNGLRSDLIYLNGHADKLMRKDKKAGLIHLDEISMWDNLPTDYVGISTDIVNATGICRMPKYCQTPVCELNVIYNHLQVEVEEVENTTIVMGSGIRLKCRYPSRDYLNVRCIDPGELMPSPTLLTCSIPADVKYEPPEKEVTGNMRVRETCSDCYEDGTSNCTAEGDGYVCNCKEGWNKFTCYKSIDLCPPQYCGPNGNCVTQLEDFFCNCTTGWIGDKCDVNIKKITWGGNKTIRIISSNTIASGLLGISSGIQISLKVLSKVITDKDPEDPQEAYQAFRSTCLTMGNLAIALFQHPDLLSSEPISCRWFFFFVHICYSLAFVFMLDEVLNVCTTIHGLHRNNWVHDNKMKKRWWLDIPARIQFPFVLVFALLWYVASQGWSKIPATWTCFGVFKRETSNIWYPLVLFNFVSIVLCFGFAENARRTLSHRIQFWTANMHLVDVTNPYIRESIEKVRRNVPYCFLLPPFMFLNWLFLCWAADLQTDTVKFVSLLFSGCYTILSMLQTLETSTGIYEYVVFYGHLYLPNCISNRILQDLTPMTWLSKNEIVARKKKTPFNGLDASSPYHPASICYITLEHEHLMLKRMTREYLDHRVTHYSKQDEATLSVYFNELRLRHVYEKNVPLEDLHLELILETWITDTKRIDQLTIPKKAKKQRETWRTRIREKNRIPPKENTNIRRMRFLKSIMDYHLKTLNPTLEYPVTGAMQRTDFRTFSPACPCVLRSQVEDLQRTWLPIIDIYIEQDWSLREVYKDVQEAEGYKPRGPGYECKKEDVEEDHWLNELRPGFIGPRSYPLVYLPALGTYLELDYYQRFADLEWARLVKHSEYLGACYDFGR